ncbi:hypothetical protein BaRGS_00040387 [Batillaria attramentaria]|uniref:DNA-directed RNA polymerase subunit n=1 Tax=Batillaria attramentaria TaxID=370345 RepID=A0ABD0J0A9_9CAEN
MDHQVITKRLSQMGFRVYSQEEILGLSIKEITNPQLFDTLQLPTVGGLYDPALGPTRHDDICDTCGQSSKHCPGHMGHIKLALPVFNPVFFKTLFKILQGTCLTCHRVSVPDVEGALFTHQMQLLEKGCVVGSMALEAFVRQYEAQQSDSMAVLKDDLLSQIDTMAKELMKDASAGLTLCTKMVDAEMSRLVTTILRQYFVYKKKCPHCSCMSRALRQEYFSRICVVGSADPGFKKPVSPRKPQPANTVPPEHEEDLEIAEESEERAEVESLLTQGKGQALIMPHLARQILRKVWRQDGKVLRKAFSCLDQMRGSGTPTDMFFLDAVLVPPSRFRPLSVMGDRKFENPQTANFSRVLADNFEIRDLLTKMDSDLSKTEEITVQNGENSLVAQLQAKWVQLQTHINCLIDSDLDKLTAANNKIPGIRQLLEKKEGLFRMHMMGKRVNYAARSVISPDPCIGTNEIGVPEVFARKLTYPQPVTPWNVHELRQYVINGPNVYPGASLVMNEDGSVTKLSATNATQREAVAKQLLTPNDTSGRPMLPKQVFRHLKDGDVMLLNRQPTLHRPSIQAHKARVLHGLKTLRMHYSNCKAYNADFDGDEMNAHFPQSELCRSEAYGIASTDSQYLVPKDGTPLAGLIQDHMVAGTALTVRGQFFSRHDYCNLLQAALTDQNRRIRLLPPAIVVSTLLLNIIPKGKKPLSLNSSTKIPEKSWISTKVETPMAQFTAQDMGESTVLVRHGELLQGVLDKAQCGNSSFGLVHCVYELSGFTLGVEDILVKDKANSKRRKIIAKSTKEGYGAAMQAFGVSPEECTESELLGMLKEAQFGTDDLKMRELDMCVKTVTDAVQDKIVRSTMPTELYKGFPSNNLQLMVQSGAKGSAVNCMQISCLLGQIELEGRRPPLMKSGRSLPSFLPYDLSPRAGGFVAGRFLTGIRPQEYFFHCMAGREGLVDTAVKTSRSGYLQRCLIKHLEGLAVSYDMTVRDSDSSVIQFSYGEDGLEVVKTPFLQPKQFPFLLQNQDVIMPANQEPLQGGGKPSKRPRRSNTAVILNGLENGAASQIEERTGRTPLAMKTATRVVEPDPKASDTNMKKDASPCPDPVSARFWSQLHTGAISETLQKSVDDLKQQLVGGKTRGEELQKLVNEKAVRSLSAPGEAVGLLCAQSIGEPSTQMTLNTFHFAGRGEMNVTLGIPRLREVLMTASSTIKTPAMDIPVLDMPEARAAARDLQTRLSCVYLSEVLQEVNISEYLHSSSHIRSVHFTLLPRDSLKDKVNLKLKQIVSVIEHGFLTRVARAANDALTKMHNKALTSQATLRRVERAEAADSGVNAPADDADSDVEENDGDAAAAKEISRHTDTLEYEGEDDEREAVGEESLQGDDIEDDTLPDSQQTPEGDDTEDDDAADLSKIKELNFVHDYRRHKKGKWCEVIFQFDVGRRRVDLKSLIDKKAREFVIQQVKGIRRCVLTERADKQGSRLHLRTEGINLQEMMKYWDILDLNSLYTNSIVDIQETYGIEAANRAIIKEVKDVFAAYGIRVDYRHLSLLADYMTFQGSFMGFNRLAIATNPSPLQKITFETSMNFLVNACTNARPDQLRSPSARLVAGQVVSSGTGCFEVVPPLTM